MHKPLRTAPALVGLAAALALSGCGDSTPDAEAPVEGVAADDSADHAGERRPDFTLPDLAGNPRHIGEWNGDLVLLNFWATWCPPCKKEMPLFQDTWEAHTDDGFTIVAVAVDEQTATEHFVADFGLEFPILIGQEDAMEIGREYGNRIGALPYSVLIDRDGTILDTHRGEVEPEDLEAWLDAHL